MDKQSLSLSSGKESTTNEEISQPLVEIEVSPAFQVSFKELKKRYPSIRRDVDPVIEQLQRGEIIGDQIPRLGYSAFKVRLKNSDVQKGKRGGYRVIYYLKTPTKVLLVTIYSKSDYADIPLKIVAGIIKEASELDE